MASSRYADKVNDPRIRQAVLKLVEETGDAVNMQFVAEHLHIAWTTARAVLLDLSLSGELKAQKTVNGWIFLPRMAA